MTKYSNDKELIPLTLREFKFTKKAQIAGRT
jgi:hypothetical protein